MAASEARPSVIRAKTPLSPPPLPVVVEGLWRAIFPRRILPAQLIAIDKDYPIQNTPVIDARLVFSPGIYLLEHQASRAGRHKPLSGRSRLLTQPSGSHLAPRMGAHPAHRGIQVAEKGLALDFAPSGSRPQRAAEIKAKPATPPLRGNFRSIGDPNAG